MSDIEMTRAEPTYARMALLDAHAKPRKPKAADTFTRYSAGANCSRRLALDATGIAESDPMDDAGHWVTFLGELVHERWQAMATRHLEADGHTVAIEVPSRHGDLTSGSADLLVDRAEVVELKTMGGFKFKSLVGATNYPAEGPPLGNVTQLALQVVGLDAEQGRIVAIGTEGISKGQIDRYGLAGDLPGRFPGAEWILTRDQADDIARAELARIDGIRSLLVDRGDLPRRVIPGMAPGAEITSAKRGTWQVIDEDGLTRAQGNTWHCDYCPHQQTCHQLGPGRVHVGTTDPAGAIAELATATPTCDPADVPVGAIKLGRI